MFNDLNHINTCMFYSQWTVAVISPVPHSIVDWHPSFRRVGSIQKKAPPLVHRTYGKRKSGDKPIMINDFSVFA